MQINLTASKKALTKEQSSFSLTLGFAGAYKNIQQKNSPNIIAVDGTYSTMKASLCEEGYKSNKNGESVTPLITTPKASLTKERSSFSLTGMFNITCDRWICFADSPHGFEEGVNERTEFFLFNARLRRSV